MKDSHGRHGGNQGKTDRGEAANKRSRASLNTDTDSLRTSRNKDRVEGHTSGRK